MTNPSLQEAFATLELPVGSGLEDVKAAYRRLARLQHPDLNPGKGSHVMTRINDAYQQVLRHLSQARPFVPYQFQEFSAPRPEPQAQPKAAAGPKPQDQTQTQAPQAAKQKKAADFVKAVQQSAPRSASMPQALPLVEQNITPADFLPPAFQARPQIVKPEPQWRLLGLNQRDGGLVYQVEICGQPQELSLPVRDLRPCSQCGGTGIRHQRGRAEHCLACGGRGQITCAEHINLVLPQNWSHGQLLNLPAQNIKVELISPDRRC